MYTIESVQLMLSYIYLSVYTGNNFIFVHVWLNSKLEERLSFFRRLLSQFIELSFSEALHVRKMVSDKSWLEELC